MGTPENISDDARDGFEIFVEELGDLDEDDVEKYLEDPSKDIAEVSKDDEKKVDEFTEYAAKECGAPEVSRPPPDPARPEPVARIERPAPARSRSISQSPPSRSSHVELPAAAAQPGASAGPAAVRRSSAVPGGPPQGPGGPGGPQYPGGPGGPGGPDYLAPPPGGAVGSAAR